MSDFKNIGSCLCGEVNYDVCGKIVGFYLCHCQYCQKDTGSEHAANIFLSEGDLKWLKGEGNIKCFTLPRTRHTKSFCSQCGSALPYADHIDDILVVPAGSLDKKIDTKPSAHLFISSKATWSEALEGIKKFDRLPI